jgi:hypothetical protein
MMNRKAPIREWHMEPGNGNWTEGDWMISGWKFNQVWQADSLLVCQSKVQRSQKVCMKTLGKGGI